MAILAFAVFACLFQTFLFGLTYGDKQNFGKYKQCMAHYGIPNWKIVDSNSNATYYNVLNLHSNKIFAAVSPIAIFVPSSVSDVQITVKCGSKAKIQLVPNSGGHSYAGLSLGTNDSIIVDFRYMNSIEMNEREESVTVGAGALVGQVNSKLWKNNGWGTPLGICQTVAMGGHAIGGGIGYFSSYYGLALDNILEIKMVDARGNAITVNPTRNPDLWWAMRGVGPGYIGLVTSVKLKMFKVNDLKLTFVRVRYHLQDFKNVLPSYTKWLDWVKQNEQKVSSNMFVVNDNYNVPTQPLSPGIEVQLLHIENPEIHSNFSSAFLAAFPLFFLKPKEIIINYPSYIELVIATSYTPVVIPTPQASSKQPQEKPKLAVMIDKKLEFFSKLTKEMAHPRYFSAKSFFVKKKIETKDLEEVQKVLSEIPNNTNGLMITSEQGAIGAVRANDCAYFHRDALYNFRIHFDSFDFEDIAASKKWMAKFENATRFMDSGETYQNFPDSELSDYLNRYYGTNVAKLIKIKRKWDRKGYFNTKMSIPVSPYPHIPQYFIFPYTQS